MSKYLSFSLSVKLFLLTLLLPVFTWGQCVDPADLVDNTLEICQGEVVTFCPEVDEYCWKWMPESAFPDVEETMYNEPTTNPIEEDIVIQLIKTNNEGDLIEEIEINIKVAAFGVKPNYAKICAGESTIFDFPSEYTGYTWYDEFGSIIGTDPTVEISDPGIYTVTATDEDLCVLTEEVEVVLIEKVDDLRRYLELDGFIPVHLTNLVYTEFESLAGVVEEHAQLTVDINGHNIDINADLNNFLGRLANHLSDVKGTIRYYDESTLDCGDLPLSIIGGSTSMPSLAVTGEYLYSIKIIGTLADDGSQMLHLKVEDLPAFEDSDEQPTIYLINIDNGTPVNMELVKDNVDAFYDLMTIEANTQIIEFIHQDDIKSRDIITLYGEPFELFAILDNFCSLHNLTEERLVNFLKPNSYEFGQLPSKSKDQNAIFTLVNTVISATRPLSLKCDTREKYFAFVTVHGNGHNAGLKHAVGAVMSIGQCLHYLFGTEEMIGSGLLLCDSGNQNEVPFQSPEELLIDMVEKTYNKRILDVYRKRLE